MSLRVAIVTESFLPQINGVTNSVLRVLETLKAREHQALVIAPTAPSPFHLGFPVLQSPNVQLLQFAVGVPTPVVSKALDDFQPDVIHVAAPFLLGAQAIGWANRNGVPSVAVYQTDVAGYLDRYNLSFAKPVIERLVGFIHSQATLNLAPTELGADYLRQLGIPRVSVWGRGVDLDLFNPNTRSLPGAQALKTEMGTKKVIGFVGRLASEKQVHRMVELFDLDANFLIVGDGPEREALESRFGERVTFTGLLTGMDLAAAYGAIDLFVHFGTEETFGQTIQEALACGIPVIAPNRGGVTALVHSGQTGYLVNPQENNAYLNAAHKLLSGDALSRFGEAARRSVLGKSWESNNSKLLEHYTQAIALFENAGVKVDELA